MNILVTGGTGFIGTHLVEALIKKGYQVKVIARDPQKAKEIEKKGAKVVIGDLGDGQFLKKELAGTEVIYHLAAIPGQIWGIPWEQYQKVNTGFTQNLLEAARQNRVKCFVFCSSIQATDHFTFYGQSKLEAEKAVKKSGLSYVIVRPGFVFGPGETRSFLRLCQAVKRGFFPLPDGGNTRLAVVFVDDLVSLFLKCLYPGVKNKIFWGIEEEASFKNLVQIINRELGGHCQMIALPSWFLKMIAVPLELFSLATGIRPLLTRQQVNFMSFDWHFKRFEEEKNFWQPKVELKEGVKKTIDWYKKEGLL